MTAYLKERIHRRPRVWVQDGDRLHQEVEDTGIASLPAAFDQDRADQPIGAEYIALYVAAHTEPQLPLDSSSRLRP